MTADREAMTPSDPPARREGITLTDREYLVVTLKASGLSWQGVAEELGVSRSTVRSAWLSARRKIKLSREAA